MKKFAVIGNPVEHSLSPVLHNWVFKKLSLNARYEKILCDHQDLSGIILRLRSGELEGVNVTLPHKETIIPFLDDLSEEARNIQAVNCVVKKEGELIGYNTDGYGFSALLQKNRISVTGKTFIVLGAGGMARSVLYTLVKGKAKTVTVVNRTPERARELISAMEPFSIKTRLRFTSPEEVSDHLRNDQVIINCTPVGMSPVIDRSPLPGHYLHEYHTLIDTIYIPLTTQFLKLGAQAGVKTINGLDLFIFQALASLDFWFHEPISRQIEIDELADSLIRTLDNR